MEDRALVPLKDTLDLGNVLAQSGFFTDAKDASKAVVKVLAGRELGFGPIASMTGVSIIQGKPSINANLMAAAIKRTGKYNYRIITLTDEVAELAFFEGGQEVGRSKFTMADAKQADLNTKDNWRKFPRNMLFARAMSNGARWYCPDIFGGVTPYTPEELGASVNGDGDVVDVQPVVTTAPKAEPEPTNGHGRPLPARALAAVMHKKAGWHHDQRTDGEPITEKQIPFVARAMADLFPNLTEDLQDKARHDVLGYLYGVNSTKALTKREASAIIDWAQDVANATAEASRILEAIAVDAGQKELPL